MERDQLLRLIDRDAERRVPTWLAIVLLAAPIVAGLIWDLSMRIAAPGDATLRMPWEQESQPYPARLDRHEQARGDLRVMAQLPYYEAMFTARPLYQRHIVTDESGYLNAPSGLADPFTARPRDITVIGASFMAAGADLSETFPAQLARTTGATVYNAAWPGRGPLRAVLHLLDRDQIGKAGERVLLMSLVQSSIRADKGGFHHLFTRLSGTGELQTSAMTSRLRGRARDWLRWNQRLDDYLLRTSPARQVALHLADHVPPMTFDRGIRSPAGLARLGPPWNQPILFYRDNIRSAQEGFAARGGEYICESFRRLHEHCKARGVRFVLLLIPDKYQLMFDHATPVNFASGGQELTGAAAPTTVFGRRLQELGIATLDLYPAFRAAQFRGATTELLYMPDDTHWSAHGIRVAAELVARHLEQLR